MRRAAISRPRKASQRGAGLRSDEYSLRARIVLASIAVFIAGTAVSMAAYPGGTWWAPMRKGHAFCGNFLCDLLHDPALNNEANRAGALWAKVSMLAFIVGIGVFWSMARCWLTSQRAARVVSKLGIYGTLPLATVPLTPSNRYPVLHTSAVLLGGLPGLLAFLLFSAALFRQSRVPFSLRFITAFLCLLVVACLCLYAQGALGNTPSPRSLPALERGAVILLLAWLLIMLHRRPICW
jgi:hypothetical protein